MNDVNYENVPKFVEIKKNKINPDTPRRSDLLLY